MSKWVGVLWVHLFGSWGFVGDEFRDKPARAKLSSSSASEHPVRCHLKSPMFLPTLNPNSSSFNPNAISFKARITLSESLKPIFSRWGKMTLHIASLSNKKFSIEHTGQWNTRSNSLSEKSMLLSLSKIEKSARGVLFYSPYVEVGESAGGAVARENIEENILSN